MPISRIRPDYRRIVGHYHWLTIKHRRVDIYRRSWDLLSRPTADIFLPRPTAPPYLPGFPIDPSILQDLRSSLRALVPCRIVASNSLSPLILVADIYSECNRNERQSHDSLTKRPKTLNRTADSPRRALPLPAREFRANSSRQTVATNFRNNVLMASTFP